MPALGAAIGMKSCDLKVAQSDVPCSLETSLSANATFFPLLPSLRCFLNVLVKLSQAESEGQSHGERSWAY